MTEESHEEIDKTENLSLFTDSCSGVLYINNVKSGDFQFAISPWHKGLSVYRKVGFSWVIEIKPPNLDLITLARQNHCQQEIGKFFKYLPGDVLKFAERFESFNFQMLKALKTSKVARELVTKSPALLLRFLNYLFNNNSPIKRIADFEGMKRLDLIKEIYGETSKSTLISMDRFLKKIIFSQYSFFDLINMTHLDVAVKSQTTRKALGSMKEVPIILLDHLFSHPEHVTYPLIFRLAVDRNWSEETSDAWKAQLVENNMYCRDALTAARLLRIPNARRVLNRCKNARELRDLHGEWVLALNNSDIFKHSKEPFPASPIPNTSDIEAIKNGEELSLEGREMRHCISSYCASVYAGDTYVYRVLRPERGTLLLAKNDDCWSIEEFRLEENQSPGEMSWDCVHNWLNSYLESL